MIILSPEEMRKVDKMAVQAGFPDILLMEMAGSGVAEKARLVLHGEDHEHRHMEEDELHDPHQRNDIGKSKVLVLVGKGNNGGDGLVTARFLDIWGFHVKILMVADEGDLIGSPLVNYNLCKLRDIDIYTLDKSDEGSLEDVENFIYRSDLVIDAMLGTGIKGDVREPYSSMIDLVNQYASTVLSVDIPSGIDGGSGNILGNAIIADYTMTMAYPKPGLVVYPGRKYCGEIEIIDLAVPVEFALKQEPQHFVLDMEAALSLLPQRPVNSHKGTFGKVGVIGGSSGMAGAPSLTGIAALKIGAGLVRVAVPENIQSTVAGYSPELITVGLKGMENLLKVEDLNKIDNLMEQSTVMALGPGLGVSDSTTKIVSKILQEYHNPVVLDADGINSLADLELLNQRKSPLIITPHPGEMARLVDEDIEEIQSRRVDFSREFAVQHKVCLVLKGAATVIALPDGDIYINPTGNEGMATAGSGDVLTGIITGLLAMGMDVEDAAILGPYLHGMAGDLAADDISSFSMTAGDIISYISEAVKNLQ